MTAIHMKYQALTIRAGTHAMSHIQTHGLSPADVAILPGAAGGPKALGLQGLDLALFGDWLPRVPRERSLIGASIGAWRFACACLPDPVKSLRRLGELYTDLSFPKGIRPVDVNRLCREMLDDLLENNHSSILTSPCYRLNLLVVQSLGLLASDERRTLGLGLSVVVRDNLISRSRLARYFNRIIAHDPRRVPPLEVLQDFPSRTQLLTSDNLRPTLLASGSIPLVMEGIQDIPGFAPGTYRDGGLLDYHLDLPYSEPGLVLYPHFLERVIPGWFDKGLFWRRANSYHLRNVVLIAPTKAYLERLPNRRLPDRRDFTRYASDPGTRQRYWRQAITESQRLGDEFLELAGNDRIAERLQPLV
ncbi:hypothetical protein IQ22_02951 [Pseudomonas duriflava]|uniref:Patatin-like phospholipase n=1 Tax=Pseudomonas duriflava TaxID=459528 RepID=A0A562Q8R9_9PSED|nr:patatin-like phospholipase family protein [Pseudomonas duriflava]TWI53108.1 hypothetical protein IQ22_02951 [Pseudomonas duriflava]